MKKPTDEQLAALRVRIAELCGWRKHDCGDNRCWARGEWSSGELETGWFQQVVPDYTGSLDAMHEAEKLLPQGKLGPYSDELRLLLLPASPELSLTLQYRQWHAEAWQRAIALDRTLSKEPIL